MRRLFFCLFILIFSGLCQADDLQLSIDPPIAWQGKVISIKLVPEGKVSSVKGRFLGQDFECYKAGDVFRGIVGVPINQKAGYYDLDLIITRGWGRTQKLTRKVKLWSTKFPLSRFWLKPHKKKLMKAELINRDWAQIEKVLKEERSDQLWSGKFTSPVKGMISQGFGHRQIINGKRSGNHRGVDFAVPIGTEVRAPNRAKVVFRRYLKVFGGTLVLDHGQGVYTLYFHLTKCLVNVGQTVEKGDIIALTGNSGISSNPHLHWGISVHDLRVDPLQWVKYEI